MNYFRESFPPPGLQQRPPGTPHACVLRDTDLKAAQKQAVVVDTPMVSVIYWRHAELTLLNVSVARILKAGPQFSNLPINEVLCVKVMEPRIEVVAGAIFLQQLDLDPRKHYLARAIERYLVSTDASATRYDCPEFDSELDKLSADRTYGIKDFRELGLDGLARYFFRLQSIPGGKPLEKLRLRLNLPMVELVELELREVLLPRDKQDLVQALQQKRAEVAERPIYRLLSSEHCCRLFGADFTREVSRHNPRAPLADNYALMWRECGQRPDDLSRSSIECYCGLAEPGSSDSRIRLNGREFTNAKFALLADTGNRGSANYLQSGWAFTINPEDPDADPDVPLIVLSALNFLVRLSFAQRARILRLINNNGSEIKPLVSDILETMGNENIAQLAGTFAALARQNLRLATLALFSLNTPRHHGGMLIDMLVLVAKRDMRTLLNLLEELEQCGMSCLVLAQNVKTKLALEYRSLFIEFLRLVGKNGPGPCTTPWRLSPVLIH